MCRRASWRKLAGKTTSGSANCNANWPAKRRPWPKRQRCWYYEKSPSDLAASVRIGRMTSLPDRIQLVDLVDEAVAAGARRSQACAEAGIPERTYWRWIAEGKAATEVADCRPTAEQRTHSTGVTVPERTPRIGLTSTGKHIMADQRPFAVRPTPPNALSDEERAAVLAACHTPAHKSLPPLQIVPRLADQGTYLVSKATFYRVLRAAGQNTRHG